LTFFSQANADNLLTATVTGMRKREVALVVPAKFKAFTQELKNLEEFEDIPVLTMNTTIKENKFPLLA